MKKRGLICLLLSALLLCGCTEKTVLEKAEQTPPIPTYPMREDIVLSAFSDAGYAVILDPNDTEETSDRSSIVLRDKEKTYTEGGNNVLVANVISAITDQGRALSLSFFGEEGANKPANLDDWKAQLGLAETFYGLEKGVLSDALSKIMAEGGEAPFEFGVLGAYCRVRYRADMAWLTIYLTQSEDAMQLLMDTPMCRVLLERFWTTDDQGRYTTIFQPYMEASAGKDNYEQARSAYYEDSYRAYYDSFSNYVTQNCIETWMANREPFKYDKLAMENDCRVTPGNVDFAVYKRYDDAVTYSFTMKLTIENGAGETTARKMTGQITFDTAQNRVSKVTFDKVNLPFEELSQQAYDSYKDTVDELFRRLSNMRETEPETTVITGLQGLPWAKYDDDTVNGDSGKPMKRLLHVDTDSDQLDAYVAVYYAPGVTRQGFGGVFRQYPDAENGTLFSTSTAYAQGMIVQTFAIAKDGATISENDLVVHEMELMTQVQEILGQSR